MVVEVEPTISSLDDEDVFVLDKGDKIWVWQGKKCSPMEKMKAAQIVHDMTLAKHIDVEVLRAFRREILGVRVIGLGEGVDVGLEDVFAAGLVEPRQLILVSLGQLLLDLLVGLAGQAQPQHLVLELAMPEVIQRRGIGRP